MFTSRLHKSRPYPNNYHRLGEGFLHLEQRIVPRGGFFHKIGHALSHAVHEVVHIAKPVIHVVQQVEHVAEKVVKKALPIIEDAAATALVGGNPILGHLAAEGVRELAHGTKPGQVLKNLGHEVINDAKTAGINYAVGQVASAVISQLPKISVPAVHVPAGISQAADLVLHGGDLKLPATAPGSTMHGVQVGQASTHMATPVKFKPPATRAITPAKPAPGRIQFPKHNVPADSLLQKLEHGSDLASKAASISADTHKFLTNVRVVKNLQRAAPLHPDWLTKAKSVIKAGEPEVARGLLSKTSKSFELLDGAARVAKFAKGLDIGAQSIGVAAHAVAEGRQHGLAAGLGTGTAGTARIGFSLAAAEAGAEAGALLLSETGPYGMAAGAFVGGVASGLTGDTAIVKKAEAALAQSLTQGYGKLGSAIKSHTPRLAQTILHWGK